MLYVDQEKIRADTRDTRRLIPNKPLTVDIYFRQKK